MKMHTLILSAAILAVAGGGAFAQVGSVDSSSNKQDVKQHQTKKKGMTNSSNTMQQDKQVTTGAGSKQQNQHRDNAGPAEPTAGEKQQK
jgi:aspartokinase-like uncharacterized kinase